MSVGGIVTSLVGAKGLTNATKIATEEVLKFGKMSSKSMTDLAANITLTVGGAAVAGAAIGGPLGAAIGAVVGVVESGIAAFVGYRKAIKKQLKLKYMVICQ